METASNRKRTGKRWRDAAGKAGIEWPVISPKYDLPTRPLKGTDLFVVENFLSSDEAKCLLNTSESIGFLRQGSGGPSKGEAYRDNDRISFTDPLLANLLWQSGLSYLLSGIIIRGQHAVGLNPNIRFYRYKVGQWFGRHIDESVDLGDGKRTHYTLLIYLNGPSKASAKLNSRTPSDSQVDPLVGGETVFYGSRNIPVAKVAPTEGMALLHIHGDKCMLHESRKVVRGVKYVLRSDVVFT